MRCLTFYLRFFAVGACLLIPAGFLHAQDAKGQAKGGAKVGPDDKQVFPDPPAGFNAVRNKAPQGEVKVVDYDSKTLAVRRQMRVYTPPGYKKD
ncbi:MAG TPA: hypothetical protein VE988_29440 [Gemmataceae bacterium]|nr:hypothetical protein [Gemmataceae bacterium]